MRTGFICSRENEIMRQVTEWILPTERIETEYGLISGQEWVELELRRMGSKNYFLKYSTGGLVTIMTTTKAPEKENIYKKAREA